MPKTVKDIGDRYYSPNKYFAISVDRERKVKRSIHMSFDDIKMPNQGSKSNSFIPRLQPVLVNRMNQKRQEYAKEDLDDNFGK